MDVLNLPTIFLLLNHLFRIFHHIYMKTNNTMLILLMIENCSILLNYTPIQYNINQLIQTNVKVNSRYTNENTASKKYLIVGTEITVTLTFTSKVINIF